LAEEFKYLFVLGYIEWYQMFRVCFFGASESRRHVSAVEQWRK